MKKNTNQKRVLLIAEYSEVGGTRTYAKQLIEFYVRNEFELTLLALGPADDHEMKEYCKSFGVKIRQYKDEVRNEVHVGKLLFQVYKEKKALKDFYNSHQPDLIVTSVGTPGLFFGHMMLTEKSIYILHTSPECHGHGWRFFYRYTMWRISVPKKCQYVTVSNYSRRCMLKSWGLRGNNKPIVVHNTSGQIIENGKKSSPIIRILTVGHVINYKNPILWLESAIQVLHINPKVKFTWIGPGPLLEICRNKVKTQNLEDNIHFVGTLSDLSMYFRECDIYVQPSKIESLGISVLDAMRYGKPCIVSNSGGLPELVQDGKSGYIVNLDETGKLLAERIIELAENQDKRTKMGLAAQDVYAQNFSPEKWEKEMLALHERILK